MNPYRIEVFEDLQGSKPFADWLRRLDRAVFSRIVRRLHRMEQGNFGDHRHLEKGLFEARLHAGSGYRIYYGIHSGGLVLLLGGGDKATQVEDIFGVLERWAQYKELNR